MEVLAKSETMFDKVAVCVGVGVDVVVVVAVLDFVCEPVCVSVDDDDGVTEGDDVPVIPACEGVEPRSCWAGGCGVAWDSGLCGTRTTACGTQVRSTCAN